MTHFMQSIIDEYNAHHVTEVTPKIDRFVSNDMSSNYYFTWQGRELYVDQFDLQESFDDETEEANSAWRNADLSDKAYALAELVQAQTVGL